MSIRIRPAAHDDNDPARRFYAALGGHAAHMREDQRGAHVLHQIADLWDDVGRNAQIV